ncbi:DUF397 domain-containing protein [Nocardiopsis tropica]|uniref:DUF397 domain-containing protein n=1 Tax=Nocardiopsis tropica TaxID=109330 RepID=UPI002E8B9021|nr:DUF397 domain-containing protein [Nocardiopsis tropica]
MSSSIPDSLFHKSSYSQPQNCVEVAEMPSATAVRDTQNRGLGHLLFKSREWAGVIAAVKADR